ncbi:hypothetical protein [Nocardioides donggukensis]|uniref:Uncharacterized protein n=1 Tax=Nocardioides donggukensis TaxID=2774019 RepID=A0A927K8X3_9ACTN|nr:hypothetical protein [Nocardioides donggukensis]MBD8869800.1 hypothetical protein [Nocardioides donggukensis]
MGSSSTIYTMGTLLSRAAEAGTEVRVLVEGCWLSGTPVAHDGYGVLLETVDHQHSLVRVEAISAVTYAPAPSRPVPAQRRPEWDVAPAM